MSEINSLIHPTAIISESAKIADNVKIGPYSIIGENVILGSGCIVGPHVIIEGFTEVGENNHFFQFSSIGSEPQDLKFKGEESKLIIGNNNKIREFVTIQPGTLGGGMLTQVGDNNLFMANTHVGHDSIVGSNCWMANSSALAGHVVVEDNVIIAGLSGIHQGVRLGQGSFMAGGAKVVKDVPPFCYAQGDRAGLVGINKISLSRKGVTVEEVKGLISTFKQIFLSDGIYTDNLEKAKENFNNNEYSQILIDFLIASSDRGITQIRKN